MTDPVVLITGALSGIGRAAAFGFARAGARVIVSGRHSDAGQALEAELRAAGCDALFCAADVVVEQQVEAMIGTVVATFGKIDVAINNAGSEGAVLDVEQQTVDNYRQVMDANVLGTLLCMKYQFWVMKAAGRGSIVNLSSNLGQRGLPGMSAYVAAKHAVEGLTKTAALEAAPFGVRVNAVAPGPIDTPMLDRFLPSGDQKKAAGASLPVGRIGTSDEIVQALIFLGLSDIPYLTGHVMAVDGGMTAR